MTRRKKNRRRHKFQEAAGDYDEQRALSAHCSVLHRLEGKKAGILIRADGGHSNREIWLRYNVRLCLIESS